MIFYYLPSKGLGKVGYIEVYTFPGIKTVDVFKIILFYYDIPSNGCISRLTTHTYNYTYIHIIILYFDFDKS